MTPRRETRICNFGINHEGISVWFCLSLGLSMLLASLSLHAQQFRVLHNFTGGGDGALPEAGVTMDKAGNLYGTTFYGGSSGLGVVYKLSNKGGWPLSRLYSFSGGNDGSTPYARVVFGPDGSLYGTTASGGSSLCDGTGCGTVFNLKPPPTRPTSVLSPWNETVVYRFQGIPDGAGPGGGDIMFDSAGDIYGTTISGGTGVCGTYGCGTVYKLTRSGGNWTESILYSFTGGSDGFSPWGGLVFDKAGNIYATSTSGGTNDSGAIVQLTPSEGGWTEITIHEFTGGSDGGQPYSGLLIDSSGNFYGTTRCGGANGGGTVFELTPAGGGYNFSVLYGFTGPSCIGPEANLVMDAAGNLYGTTVEGGTYGCGAAFKLSPSAGGWTYMSLHDFNCSSDGAWAAGELAIDANGNIYGTTFLPEGNYAGNVFEITP
jgi:uncharacterized repeat protein (TIGR03803 family)